MAVGLQKRGLWQLNEGGLSARDEGPGVGGARGQLKGASNGGERQAG